MSIPANFQCSHRVVLVPFCIICSPHLIAVWFLQAIWLPEWSLQLPSFFALYVCKGGVGRSNTFLRTLCFRFAVHEVCRPRAICRVIDIVLLCPSSHTWFQEFSVINPSVLLQDLYHALVRCLVSLLMCAVLYVITFTPSFISSPECVHLSPSTCEPLIMFLHLILCSSYCIPHAIIKCRIDDLEKLLSLPRGTVISHIKTARFVRWNHSLPTFGSAIALSARMSATSFAGSPWCAFTLTKNEKWRLPLLLLVQK